MLPLVTYTPGEYLHRTIFVGNAYTKRSNNRDHRRFHHHDPGEMDKNGNKPLYNIRCTYTHIHYYTICIYLCFICTCIHSHRHHPFLIIVPQKYVSEITENPSIVLIKRPRKRSCL